MKINLKYLSFYYQGMEEVPDIEIDKEKTGLLIIDMQKEFVYRDCGNYQQPLELLQFKTLVPFRLYRVQPGRWAFNYEIP